MAKILSIEIGNSLTRICEMDFRTKNPKVYKYVSVPTPERVVEDGFLTGTPEFAAAVKKALNVNKIKTKQVVFSVTSSKIATREVMLPVVKMNQIDGMIKANASDYFPIDLSEYELAHLVLGTVKAEGQADRFRVMVMAAGKNLVAGYENFAKLCGLNLVSLDHSGNSVFQVMKNECKEETEMVIKVEEKTTYATVIAAQNLVLQRNIAYGVDSAVETLMDSKAFEEDIYKDALELMKRRTCIKLALSENVKPVDDDDEEDIEDFDDLDDTAKMVAAKQEISEALMPLISNVGRVVDLYNSKNIENPIKRIRLVGLGSDISGLSKLFTNELGVRTVVMNKFDTISWNKGDGDGTPGRYIASIGAAIAPVGFISEEKKKSDSKEVNYKSVTVLAALFFIAASAALAVLGMTQYNEAKAEQARLQRLEATYMPAESVYNLHNHTVALFNEIRAGYRLTESPNDGLVAFLEELEEKLPADAVVKEFTSDGTQAVIAIQTMNMEEAAKVIQTMRGFDSLMNVSVAGISTEEVDTSNSDHEEEADDGEETAGESTEEGDGGENANAELSAQDDGTRIVFSLVCLYYPTTVEEAASEAAAAE
ncbi:MAG: pilus assembly protein PilM [Lachnospiraceae bacterium]|nr:pilus assembly protein PilM [Lachnospiraceae bacterium]